MRNDDKIIDEAFENNKEIKKLSKFLYLASKSTMTTEENFLELFKIAYSSVENIIYNGGGDNKNVG